MLHTVNAIYSVNAQDYFWNFAHDLCEDDHITGGDLREAFDFAVRDFFQSGDNTELLEVMNDSVFNYDAAFSQEDIAAIDRLCAIIACGSMK